MKARSTGPSATRAPRVTDTGIRRLVGVLGPALIGWALCGATIGIGRALTSMQNTLIAHAIAAPLIFAAVAYLYFKKFNYTTPLQTAVIYVLAVMLMDLVVVATFIEQSYAMFGSLLGTWLPFALIFGSTYAVGLHIVREGE